MMASLLRAGTCLSSTARLQLRLITTSRPFPTGGKRVAKKDNAKIVPPPRRSPSRRAFPSSRLTESIKARSPSRIKKPSTSSHSPKSTLSRTSRPPMLVSSSPKPKISRDRVSSPKFSSKDTTSPSNGFVNVQSRSFDPHRTNEFTSPPLIPELLRSLKEMIGEDAKPTEIQSLALQTLQALQSTEWRRYLMASETGSGKSIAYLLPILQNLKTNEIEKSPSRSRAKPMNPRAIILTPTHELSRQIAGFAKMLSHNAKLRVLCTSRQNLRGPYRDGATASKMKKTMEGVFYDEGDGDVTVSSRGPERDVDIVVGTVGKLLDLEKGKGWDWTQRARQRALKDGKDPDSVREFWVDPSEMGLENVEWVVIDEADVLLNPDFADATRQLLADISAARGHPIASPSSMLSTWSPSNPHSVSYPFNIIFTSATVPNYLDDYLAKNHPEIVTLASNNLHRLPGTIRTEHAEFTSGNKYADIEHRIRRVWAEDRLAHVKRAEASGPPQLSKIIMFVNKNSRVQDLSEILESHGIKCVALTANANVRQRGSNQHLDGFLRGRSLRAKSSASNSNSLDPAVTPHILITTSLLSRGLDFSPAIKHVFILDEPQDMVDFLHRAGRTGRAGEAGKVVIFGRGKGRGSKRTVDMRKRMKALR